MYYHSVTVVPAMSEHPKNTAKVSQHCKHHHNGGTPNLIDPKIKFIIAVILNIFSKILQNNALVSSSLIN